jgi:hypothetical protein
MISSVLELLPDVRQVLPASLDLPLILACALVVSSLLVFGRFRKRKAVRVVATFDERFQPVITGIQTTEDRSMKISQLALWFELNIANRGAVPLAIDDLFVRYNKSSFDKSRPMGIFRELDGSGEHINLGGRVRLPVTLEAREQMRAYLLVSVPISETLGDLLAKTNSNLLFRSEWIRREVDEAIDMMSHTEPGSMALRKDYGIKSVEVRDAVLHEVGGVTEFRPNAGFLPQSAWAQVVRAAETKAELRAARALYFTGLTFEVQSASKRKLEAFVPTAQSPFSFPTGARTG